MRNEPILASRRLPAGTDGYRVPLIMKVYGGLNYLKGNSAPYFSLTYWQHRVGLSHQCESGGAGHERILKLFPRFADLAALHLSDIDGVPMHAEANGWYWLAGSLGGLGEQYHGGNVGYGSHRSEAECLDFFARHCRITEGEARTIRTMVGETYRNGGDERRELARARWGKLMESMRARWKREAEAAIAAHGLQVYGDPWQREEVPA
jgi:hypothetical protein